MEQRILDELCQRIKQQIVLLIEVDDLTGQLAQALDRKDQLSLQMMLSMRQDPLQKIQEISNMLNEYVLSLPEEDAIRSDALLRGASDPTPEEAALCEQVAKKRRLVKKVIEQDREISLQLNRERSFYNTFREKQAE